MLPIRSPSLQVKTSLLDKTQSIYVKQIDTYNIKCYMKPSKKTIIYFDRVFRKHLKGEIEDDVYWHYSNSLFTMYESYLDFHLGMKKLANLRTRKYRWKKRVKSMCGELYLVTLTLDENHIKLKEIRQRVTRALSYFDDYYACADYGKKNGRLHYHAICSLFYYKAISNACNYRFHKRKFFCDLKGFDWSLGYYSICPIVLYSDKTFNYAFKSASYAFKRAEEGIDDTRPFGKIKTKRLMELEDDTEIYNDLVAGGNL